MYNLGGEIKLARIVSFSTHSDPPIRVLVTSGDVLHSWARPRLGLKVDAVPGRLNQLRVEINSVGVFYGQCSEICGASHRFIPIATQFLKIEDWAAVSLRT